MAARVWWMSVCMSRFTDIDGCGSRHHRVSNAIYKTCILMLLHIPIGLPHSRAGYCLHPSRTVIRRHILKAREFRLGKSCARLGNQNTSVRKVIS